MDGVLEICLLGGRAFVGHLQVKRKKRKAVSAHSQSSEKVQQVKVLAARPHMVEGKNDSYKVPSYLHTHPPSPHTHTNEQTLRM